MAVAKADLLPFLAMVIVEFVFAWMNITSKLAMDSGLKPLVLVAYRQVFATIAMFPLAYFFEWKTLPPITKPLLFQIFICSLTGASGNLVLYFMGLQNSTPTIGCALTNILPAVTFILAVLFRQESLEIKKISGQAKVLGTMLCVGGAMLLSFYHGHAIHIGQSKLHWSLAEKMENQVAGHKSRPILGSLLIIGSSISWACWFIVQAKMSSNFPAPYTSTFLICLMGSVECMIVGISINHQMSEWSLKSLIRLLTVLYAGIVCTGIGYTLTSWSIQKKGALYASVFNPLLLVIVAIMSWAVLREKLHVGTVIGSLLIILGLYAVLWGKNREAKAKMEDKDTAMLMMQKEADIEIQSTTNSKSNENGIGNGHTSNN